MAKLGSSCLQALLGPWNFQSPEPQTRFQDHPLKDQQTIHVESVTQLS